MTLIEGVFHDLLRPKTLRKLPLPYALNAFAIPVREPILLPVLGFTDENKPMEQGKKSKSPVPKFLRQRLRDRAIAGVRKDMIHAGRTEDSYSEEELEYLVAEKERDIWSGIGWKGFGVAALLLGINIGI